MSDQPIINSPQSRKQGPWWMPVFHPYPIASYLDPTYPVENYFKTSSTFMLWTCSVPPSTISKLSAHG